MVGYTRLVRADEEGTLARFRTHLSELVDPKITEHKGRIVKLMGDGLLVEFTSIVDAVRCAAEIQRGMAARNFGMPENAEIVFRIGINLGDVIVEGENIYGDGVNVATRMQEIAPPGGISVSGVVYDSVRDKLAPGFEDLGPQHIKNSPSPCVHIWWYWTRRRQANRQHRNPSPLPPACPRPSAKSRFSAASNARAVGACRGI